MFDTATLAYEPDCPRLDRPAPIALTPSGMVDVYVYRIKKFMPELTAAERTILAEELRDLLASLAATR